MKPIYDLKLIAAVITTWYLYIQDFFIITQDLDDLIACIQSNGTIIQVKVSIAIQKLNNLMA